MRFYSYLVSCVGVALISGCAGQAHWDAVKLREYALDYYANQMMDNLIRASQGLPFLQVKIAAMNSYSRMNASGTFNGGETTTRGGGVTGLLNSATRPLTFALNGGVEDQVTFDTLPLTEDITAYVPYLNFLALKDGTQLLKDSGAKHYSLVDPAKIQSIKEKTAGQDLRPGDYVPGTLRKWKGRTFYIPTDFRQAYFDLNLALQGNITWGDEVDKDGKKTGKVVGKILKDKPSELLMQFRRNESLLNQIQSQSR